MSVPFPARARAARRPAGSSAPDRFIGALRAGLRALCVAVAGAALPALVLAQTTAPATGTTSAAAMPSGPSLLPMVLVLLLVLALIPVSMWVLKRMGAGGAAGVAGMKVVATLPLGPRERLVVVEAGERWLLLGVTPGAVNRVGTLPKGALPTGTAGVAGLAAGGFSQLLDAAKARKNHGA